MPSRLLSPLTPWHVVLAARATACAVLIAIGLAYGDPGVHPDLVAGLSYFLSVVVLLAFPTARSADLTTSVAIVMTAAELLGAYTAHQVDLFRWLVAMAAIGAAILPMRALRLRALASAHPYRFFSDFDRRAHGRRRRVPPTAAVWTPMAMPPPLLISAGRTRSPGL